MLQPRRRGSVIPPVGQSSTSGSPSTSSNLSRVTSIVNLDNLWSKDATGDVCFFVIIIILLLIHCSF